MQQCSFVESYIIHQEATNYYPHHPHIWSADQKDRRHAQRQSRHYRQRYIMQMHNVAVYDDDSSSKIKGTIQILMSDTGGGHRASANALRDAFDVLYPNQIECDIVDIYTEYGPFWPFNDYVNIYKIMAENSWMWDIFYHFGATPVGLILNDFFLNLFCFEPFTQCMARSQGCTKQRADMVISVHPLTQDVPLNVLGYLDSNYSVRSYTARTKTPFVTVITDLGSAHPTWFNRNVDVCYVPTNALYEKAIDRGLSPNQIKQYGLPIRKGFWNDYSNNSRRSSSSNQQQNQKEQLRKELQLNPDLPTVLIVGGGDGMGGIVNLAKELGNQLSSISRTNSYQIIVVCGKNKNAKRILETYPFSNNISVHIKGFVNNMDQYMKASDVLVTKAGPGTIAEASICGLPCMMFSFLPGQEAGNIPYVEKSGFGKYSKNPTEIASIVSAWLSSPSILDSMKRAAINASRPNATLDIAKDIASILFTKKKKERIEQQQNELSPVSDQSRTKSKILTRMNV